MNLKYRLESLAKLSLELNGDFEALKKAHAAEVAKLKEAMSVGLLVKEFIHIPAATINVRKVEKSSYYSYTKHYTLNVGWQETEGYGGGKSEDFTLTKEGGEKAKELIAKMIEESKPAYEKNKAVDTENSRICTVMGNLISSCGFADSKVVYNSRKRKNETEHFDWGMKLRGGLPTYAHASYSPDEYKTQLFKGLDDILKIETDRLAAEAKAEQAKKLVDPLLMEAVSWLGTKGKVLDKDFKLEDAVETANELAFTEEVNKNKESGGPFYFSGQNCDSCDGWDGESHRCNCGNRRVSWVRDSSHAFKNPCIYGEAH